MNRRTVNEAIIQTYLHLLNRSSDQEDPGDQALPRILPLSPHSSHKWSQWCEGRWILPLEELEPLSPGMRVQGCRWWRKRAERMPRAEAHLQEHLIKVPSSPALTHGAAGAGRPGAEAAAFGPLNSHADGSMSSAAVRTAHLGN